MDIHEICEALKDLGVLEVILDSVNNRPTIEFSGKSDGEYFKIVANNVDFSNNNL